MTGMAQPNVSRIVGIMVENETIQLEKDGRRTICRLKVIPLDELPAPSMR